MGRVFPVSSFLAQLREDLAAFERDEAEAMRLASEGRETQSPHVKSAVRAAVQARINQARLRQLIRLEEENATRRP
jgi:hypothetical protein